jgi:hypothetical protein
MLRMRLLLVAVPALMVVGCTRELYFRPAEQEVSLGPGPVEQAEYRLAEADGQAAEASVSLAGRLGDKKHPGDLLTVRIEVRNGLKQPVTLPVSRFTIVDDHVRKFNPPRILVGKGEPEPEPGSDFVVSPESSGVTELAFDIPAGDDERQPLKKVRSLQLQWTAVTEDGKATDYVTKFVRASRPKIYEDAPVEGEVFYEPYPAPYYGPYYYGGGHARPCRHRCPPYHPRSHYRH